MEKGDMEQIIADYRPLMISQARKWPVYLYEDALQEAHVAVIEAVDRFDPTVGCYFGVYLRQRVRAHLRTWGRRQTRWLERNVSASYTRDAEEEGVPVEEWADDAVSSDLSASHWEALMQPLSPRERLVMKRQVVEGYTLAEIAVQEGVSRHTVQTWKKRAMKKLRKSAADTMLTFFS